MRRFLDALISRGHDLYADLYVVEEARRNLEVKEGGAGDALDAILLRVTVARVVADESLARDLPLPEKDHPVLAAAIYQKCDALVTGDRAHFGVLYGKTVHGVAIHSPRSLAEAALT